MLMATPISPIHSLSPPGRGQGEGASPRDGSPSRDARSALNTNHTKDTKVSAWLGNFVSLVSFVFNTPLTWVADPLTPTLSPGGRGSRSGARGHG